MSYLFVFDLWLKRRSQASSTAQTTIVQLGSWVVAAGFWIFWSCCFSGTWKSALISTMVFPTFLLVFPTFLCLLNAEISLEISQKRLQVQTVTACQSHKVHVALRGGLASESQRFCLDSRRGPVSVLGKCPWCPWHVHKMFFFLEHSWLTHVSSMFYSCFIHVLSMIVYGFSQFSPLWLDLKRTVTINAHCDPLGTPEKQTSRRGIEEHLQPPSCWAWDVFRSWRSEKKNKHQMYWCNRFVYFYLASLNPNIL